MTCASRHFGFDSHLGENGWCVRHFSFSLQGHAEVVLPIFYQCQSPCIGSESVNGMPEVRCQV